MEMIKEDNTMKEHEIPCELCGEVYDPDELIPFDDRLICPECLENETTLCACCGQRGIDCKAGLIRDRARPRRALSA